jgi:peptidoglycan hydrolase-like protein with peptidoglycan-binding domain
MSTNAAIRVLEPLAPSANALDVLKIKSAMATLGYYEVPEWGLSQFPDPALFKAIQAFQRKHGLKADGVMKPGGPTEASLRATLTPQQTGTALYATARTIQALGRNGDTLLAHITPEEAHLLDAITDGASINPTTGLLEFWSAKGGYSGPNRTHTPKNPYTKRVWQEQQL